MESFYADALGKQTWTWLRHWPEATKKAERKRFFFFPDRMALYCCSKTVNTVVTSDSRVLYPLKLPPAIPPASSPHGLDLFLTLFCDAPTHLSFPHKTHAFAHTPPCCFCACDLVSLKQGIWFDRLPVLGLHSTQASGSAGLSQRAHDCCVSPCPCGPPLQPVLLPFVGTFPACYRDAREDSVEWHHGWFLCGVCVIQFCFWQEQRPYCCVF